MMGIKTDNGLFQTRKLPLIVDVAIDNNGKQLYQVHESSKFIRREMPKSTNFHQSLNLQPNASPERKILGDKSTNQAIHNNKLEYSEYCLQEKSKQNFTTNSIDHQVDDIWSDDVEKAFEEGLKIIPKNGLSKIKICGKSCGRNELLSDYILNKTGKFRTRKQVSSHIQVIKNLGQNLPIIELIDQGPVFKSSQDQINTVKKFEQIFFKINLNKSLGYNEDNVNTTINKRRKIRSNSFLASENLKSTSNLVFLELVFTNFIMTISVENLSNPICITKQNDTQKLSYLQLDDSIYTSARFPGLSDFRNSGQIPILYNMAKLWLPTSLCSQHSIETGFNSIFTLGNKTSSSSSIDGLNSAGTEFTNYHIFTCIYSNGSEVIKFNDEKLNVNKNQSFLTKFWKFFFCSFSKKSQELTGAIKGLTIKQIIYEKEPSTSSNFQTSLVPKLKIKMILLWEFAMVDDGKDAITTTQRLILPPKQYNADLAGGNCDLGTISKNGSFSTSQNVGIDSRDAVIAGENSNLSSHISLTPDLDSSSILLDYTQPGSNAQVELQNLSQQQIYASNSIDHTSPIPAPSSQTAIVNPAISIQFAQSEQQAYLNLNLANSQINYVPHRPSSNVDLTVVNTQKDHDYQLGGLLYPEGFSQF